jgi:hypothetical protein
VTRSRCNGFLGVSFKPLIHCNSHHDSMLSNAGGLSSVPNIMAWLTPGILSHMQPGGYSFA